MYICIGIHTDIHIHTCVYMYIYIWAHIYIYIYIYIHTYIHTYLRTYVRTYIHTYIQFADILMRGEHLLLTYPALACSLCYCAVCVTTVHDCMIY